MVELGGLDQRPDLRADGGQLGRVHRRDVGVLVEQLLQPGDVAVGLGAGHRRHQVVDQRGVRPPLGLRALARVVDQERVDQRQVAERGVRRRRRPTGRRSCRAATPGCRACRGAPPRARRTTDAQPPVGGQVVVATAAGRGRGRSRSGSRRSRAAAGPSRTTLPARSAASTMSPPSHEQRARRRRPSARSIAARRSAGSVSNHARYSAAGMRTGLPDSCSSVSQSASCPPAAISAWTSASPSRSATPGSASGPSNGPMS